MYTLEPYPASVGGHDTDGWISYGHDDGTGNSIEWIATTENGASWSTGTAISGETGEDLAEANIARVPGEDKWIMLLRPNQSSGKNAYLYKSTDLKNWNGPHDTGQTLGKNPSTVVAWRDQFYWL